MNTHVLWNHLFLWAWYFVIFLKIAKNSKVTKTFGNICMILGKRHLKLPCFISRKSSVSFVFCPDSWMIKLRGKIKTTDFMFNDLFVQVSNFILFSWLSHTKCWQNMSSATLSLSPHTIPPTPLCLDVLMDGEAI